MVPLRWRFHQQRLRADNGSAATGGSKGGEKGNTKAGRLDPTAADTAGPQLAPPGMPAVIQPSAPSGKGRFAMSAQHLAGGVSHGEQMIRIAIETRSADRPGPRRNTCH